MSPLLNQIWFMLQHVNDLHQHVLKSGNLKTRDKDWLDIKKRVSNQVVLRIITCIQIASKLTSHYRVLSPHRARRFLQDAGHRYNTESIMQSELRVIKTLNFRLAKHSPLVYLEAILESLGHMDPSANILKLHDLGMKLLDLVYLQYDDVYYKLYQVATGGSPSTSQQIDSFASVRADKMLLMVSIVTASAYIIENESHQKTMIMLSKLTKIPEEDIADFASVIFNLVVDTRED
ncbi:cyclin N-terminal domain-containing protein 1-like isoform X2 [Dreissena polymorpha]|uniref:cyclin N-terminal domain-containing protein 1-like isoform X2 n=1 Tax=Dreissena polymorpha TaxID=45954 RepID=UPI0022643FB3|nr:cyclin N-terminal domain-containing protein 1-like isoform X2 [Dreissena polymorpha]